MANDWNFLVIDGVKGESTDDKHPDAIQFLEWHWSGTNGGAYELSREGFKLASEPPDDPISVVAEVDKSTPELLAACAKGTHFKKATLYSRKEEESPDTHVVTLNDVVVKSVNLGAMPGSDDTSAIMSLELAFGGYEEKYTPIDRKSSSGFGTPIETSYSFVKNVTKK
jgi:type VI secretion system secreted protein Hcp